MKIEKKMVDVAVDKVMSVVFDTDTNDDPSYRLKFYRKVAWDLMTVAAAMEYETELFDNEL